MSTVLERFQAMMWEEAHPNEKNHTYIYIVPGGQNVFNPELIETERQKRVERITKPKSKGKVVKEEPVIKKGPPIEEIVKPNPVGQIFGELMVVQELDEKTWLCHCECGGIITAGADEVRSGKVTSCGHCQKPENIVKLYKGRGSEIQELYNKALTGDEDAIEEVIKYYEPRLNNIIELLIAEYRLSSEIKDDLMQIGRITIWKCIGSPWDTFKSWSCMRIYNEMERYLKQTNVLPSGSQPAVSVGSLEDNQEELESSTYAIEYESNLEWLNGLSADEFIDLLKSDTSTNLSPEKICIFVDHTLKDMTLAQIGKKYGKSPERIRQLEHRVVWVVRRSAKYNRIGRY
jgi:RNA polymerase sigma factor (sigma-70 family)